MQPQQSLSQILLTLVTLAAQTVTAEDACGPKIPVENVTDTCTAPLEQSYLPAIYGVQCFGNMYPPFLPPNGTDCNDLVPQICSVMSASDLVYDVWHFVSNPTNTCTAGFYMPRVEDGSKVLSAPVPTNERCQATIFDSMLNACTGGPNWNNDQGKWNSATVNLMKWPGNGQDGTPAYGGSQYPSYYVAGGPPPATPSI